MIHALYCKKIIKQHSGLWIVNVFGQCECSRADDVVFVFKLTIIVLKSDFKHELNHVLLIVFFCVFLIRIIYLKPTMM